MTCTLVIADGGVGSLLACLAAGCRRATGPRGLSAAALLPATVDPRQTASRLHAAISGLEEAALQHPIESIAGEDGRLVHRLVESALLVRHHGGGEVVWPVSGVDGDVSAVALVQNKALLVSQLVTLAVGTEVGVQVRVRAPYADLTDRQLVDLVLDMDAPIWTCWWMSPAGTMSEALAAEALQERSKWSRLLKEAGWTGSLEAKAADQAAHVSAGRRGVRT